MDRKDQLTNVRKMALAESTRRGRIVAITSGKGGVGKSNIALNLSIALTQKGNSVILFDADPHLANVNVLIGKTSSYTLADVVFGDKDLSDITLEDSSGLKIVSASSGTNDLAGLEDGIKDRFFQEIYRCGHTHDFIIIDTSAGLSETIIDFAVRADEVVVVTTPEPAAVSDAYALVKVLFGMNGKIQFKTLINIVNSKDEAEEVFERFSLVMGHFLNMETEYLGFVIEDKHVRSAVIEQNPFLHAFPESQASKCIYRIAQRMSA